MNTFLPYSDYEQSARVLDRAREGKQRVETKQIIIALEQGPSILYRKPRFKKDPEARYVYGPVPIVLPEGHEIRKTPWFFHPATQAWRDRIYQLSVYGTVMCAEWKRRGYQDSLLPWFEQVRERYADSNTSVPSWVSDAEVTRAYQSNLIRKNPAYYRPFFPNIPDNLPYIWHKP